MAHEFKNVIVFKNMQYLIYADFSMFLPITIFILIFLIVTFAASGIFFNVDVFFLPF